GGKRANEHRTRGAFRLAHEVQAPVNAIGTIDVSVAGRPEHHRIARSFSDIRMSRRIGMVISLDLHDNSAGTVERQQGAYQFRCNFMHATGEEGRVEAGSGTFSTTGDGSAESIL